MAIMKQKLKNKLRKTIFFKTTKIAAPSAHYLSPNTF